MQVRKPWHLRFAASMAGGPRLAVTREPTQSRDRGAMDDRHVVEAVRGAVIWAKAEVVALAPEQIEMSSLLTEPPICLDSLESIAMVSHLEEALGLVAEDEHFFAGSVRTVGDVVDAVKGWVAVAETAAS
jgi:acyl carrier protein